MSLTTAARGRHTNGAVIGQLRSQLREVESDNELLVRDGRDMAAELHTALIRGCQDAMRIAALEAVNAAVLAANEELRRETVKAKADTLRAQAEQKRLRQAVINARPKITQVDTQLVRPFAPAVVLPYVSPVPYRSTANDETQQLPAIDLPEPWPVYATAAAT
jgi:hypothetical protein